MSAAVTYRCDRCGGRLEVPVTRRGPSGFPSHYHPDDDPDCIPPEFTATAGCGPFLRRES